VVTINRPFIVTCLLLAGSLSQAGVALAHGTAEEAEAIDPHAQHKQMAAAAQALEAIDPHAQHQQMAAANSQVNLAEINLPGELSMLNRFGEKVDLRADIIGDRIAVVNFVYTNCTTVCPVTSSIFSMLQTLLGEQVGREVALITITVDPARDNPHRMRGFAQNYKPGDGWSWLTGDKGAVDSALKAFGAYTPNFEDHPAMVLVGDESHEKWYRLYGFPAPDAIEARVRELLNNRSS